MARSPSVGTAAHYRSVYRARLELRLRAAPLLAASWAEFAREGTAAAWRSGAPRRREWRARILALLIGLVLSWVSVEVALRVRWLPLPQQLGAALLSCYDPNDTYHAIYFEDPRLGIILFKPNFETTCFWNGYRWQHHGDRWGFRNPETWDQADVVLLGDSMTYGHGVQEDETIAHHLRRELGTRVVNLGITGGGPVQYVAHVRNFALRLAPKVVVVLFFANDIEDVMTARTLPELRAFVEQGKGRELGIYSREELVAAAPDPTRWTLERFKRTSLAFQSWVFYRQKIDALLHPLAHPQPSPPTKPEVDAPEKNTPVYRVLGPPVVRAYVAKAIVTMAESAHEVGAELVVGFMPAQNPASTERDVIIPELLRTTAEEEHLPYLDLRPDVSDPDGAPLPGTRLVPLDGHFSAVGTRRVAGAIARFLVERGLVPPHGTRTE